MSMMSDHTQLYQQFVDNDDFRRWMAGKVFALTYEAQTAA